MSSEPQVENLVFDGCSATVYVEPLNSSQFRILGPEIAVVTNDYACGDIVEATRNDANDLVVLRCVKRGNYRSYEYCLPSGWLERDAIKRTLGSVERFGGRWEGVFGGVLLIALPPECDYDPSQDIMNAMSDSTDVR